MEIFRFSNRIGKRVFHRQRFNISLNLQTRLFKRIKKKGKVELSSEMSINYSVRRIKKIGLLKYLYLILKMDIEIMLLGRKPLTGDYAKMEYN